MRFILTIVLTVCFFIVSNAQNVEKEVGNNLHVTFPGTPTYAIKSGTPTYMLKTNDCLYIVLIQHGALPNYKEFLGLPTGQQESLRETLLTNVIKGKTDYAGATNTNVKSIKVGIYPGRMASYSAINPATGEPGMRYSKVVLAHDKVYNFECWYLTNGGDPQSKDMFMSSIKVK